jgi:hypothetical protein
MPIELILQHLADAIDRGALVEPPDYLGWFAREETLVPQAGRERRRYRRYSLITNVIVLPLDERLNAAGNPFVALSSGLSIGGIRLIHTEPAPSAWLFVEIAGQPVRYLVSVLRSRPVGNCFEIAGELVNPAGPRPATAAPGLEVVEQSAIGSPGDGGLSTHAPSAADDVLHWAGLSAAVQLITAERNAVSRALF